VPQLLSISLITLHIFAAFRLPEFSIRSGHDSAIPTPVHVPETAVYEDNPAVPWQDQIRLSRQISAVQPKSIPKAMDD